MIYDACSNIQNFGDGRQKDLTTYSKKGRLMESTVLHLAVRDKDLVGIQTILKTQGNLVNVPNNFGDTPLHIAALEADFEVILTLLQGGACIRKENNRGEIALELLENTKENSKATQLLLKFK